MVGIWPGSLYKIGPGRWCLWQLVTWDFKIFQALTPGLLKINIFWVQTLACPFKMLNSRDEEEAWGGFSSLDRLQTFEISRNSDELFIIYICILNHDDSQLLLYIRVFVYSIMYL